MRVQHVAQAATSWPDATEIDRNAGARLTETIERIRWRLWHGQVRRALDLIDETIAIVDAPADDMSPMTAAARKVTRLLGDLETYVSGQSAIIIDYATARRCEAAQAVRVVSLSGYAGSRSAGGASSIVSSALASITAGAGFRAIAIGG